ncbi:MAG: PGF-pre-PGF domain-containing protein, partial [Candidatus Hadarchaeales archaeon]
MSRDELWIWLKWAEKVFVGSGPEVPSHADFSSPTWSLVPKGAPNIAGGAAPFPQADFSTPKSGPDDVGGAAPPTFVPLWQKVASVLLCIFLLFSPFPAPPVAAAEISAGGGAFENTENVGGVIRLVYGYTSGTFTSEPIYVGENWEGLALWWREEEPSLLQEISRAGLQPSTSPAAGNAGSLGPVADAWTNITISGYLESAGNVNGSSESTGGGFGPHAESWTNITISGFWLSENGVGTGEAENSLPKFAALDENSPTLEQGTDNLNLPENSEVPENAVENLQGGAPADNTIQQENAAPSAKENILLTSSVRVQVRVSENGEGWSDWMGPDGTSSSYFESPPADLSRLSGRYLQFRIYFRSDGPRLSGASGPLVSAVMVLRGGEAPAENFAFEEVEELQVGEKVGARIRRLQKGVGKRVELRRPGLSLKRVSLKVLRDLDNVEIWAEPLENLSGIPPLESRRVVEGNNEYVYVGGGLKVYSYVDISTSVPEGLLAEGEVEFRVPKGWMEANGLKASSFRIYHFNGSGWEELPITAVGEDGGEVFVSARTSSFSPFSFAYVTGETVYEGGTTGISGAMYDDGVYENIFENAYRFGREVKTVEFIIGQDTNTRAGGSTVSWPFTFYIPES